MAKRAATHRNVPFREFEESSEELLEDAQNALSALEVVDASPLESALYSQLGCEKMTTAGDFLVASVPSQGRRLVKRSVIALRCILALQLPEIVVPRQCLLQKAQQTYFMTPKSVPTDVDKVDITAFQNGSLWDRISLEFHLDQRSGLVAPVRALSPARSAPTDALWLLDATYLTPIVYPCFSTSAEDVRSLRFRPEFLQDYPGTVVPTAGESLCPLGSSAVAKHGIFTATLYLLNVTVPQLGAALNREGTTLSGRRLCAMLHSWGVNLRFLGWLLPWVSHPDVKKAICTEIIARSYKFVEDVTSGADWQTLTRIAFNRFFPCHLHIPLRTLHSSSLAFLSRLHPRYSIDVDTLETDHYVDCSGFSLGVDPESLPPTPQPAQGYEYELIGPDSVDSELLDERILELCNYSVKLMPLPGRSHCRISNDMSQVFLNSTFDFQREALLRCGTSPSAFPLLQSLALTASKLFPFEVHMDHPTDHSASKYFAIMNTIIDELEPVKAALARRLRLALYQVLLSVNDPDETREFEDVCHAALSQSTHPLTQLGVLMRLSEVDSSPSLLQHQKWICSKHLSPTHPVFQAVNSQFLQLPESLRKTLEDPLMACGVDGETLLLFRKHYDSLFSSASDIGDRFIGTQCRFEAHSGVAVPEGHSPTLGRLSDFIEDAMTRSDACRMVVVGEYGTATTLRHTALSLLQGTLPRRDGAPLAAFPVLVDVRKAEAPRAVPRASLVSSLLRRRKSLHFGDDSHVSQALRDNFPGLTESQLSQLYGNKTCVLLLVGCGECGDRSVPSLSALGFEGWCGPVILSVSHRTTEHARPPVLVNSVFGVHAPKSKVVSLVPLSPDEIETACGNILSRHPQRDGVSLFLKFHLTASARVKALCQIPMMLRWMIDALLILRSQVGVTVTLSSILDAVMWNRFLLGEDTAHQALLYASGLAVRLRAEGLYEVVNPEARIYCSCLPIRFEASSGKVTFRHPVFRSYFQALRAWLELAFVNEAEMDAFIQGSDQTPSAATQMLSVDFVRRIQEAAMKRTGANVKRILMSSFGAGGKLNSLLLRPLIKARTRMAANRMRLSQGEFLCTRSVGSSTDPFLLDLLADRAAVHAKFSALLWEAVQQCTKEADSATLCLGANAASILCRAGLSFSGKSFFRKVLAGAALRNVTCFGTDFRLTDLRCTVFTNAILDQCEFRSSDVKGVDFGVVRYVVDETASRTRHSLLCVAFNPNDSIDHIVTGNEAGDLQLWDCETAEIVCQGSHGTAAVTNVSFSQDGNLVASCSASADAVVFLWCASTLTKLSQLVAHSDRVTSVAFIGTETLITSSLDWSVQRWHHGPKPVLSRGKLRVAPTLAPSALVKRHTCGVTALAYTPALHYCASVGLDGVVFITEVEGRHESVSTFEVRECKGFSALAFSPDGLRIVVPTPDGVDCHNSRTGAFEKSFKYTGGVSDIASAIVFSPDHTLLVASLESSVIVWDTGTGEPLLRDRQHTSRVSSLCFNHTGSKMFSTGWDGVVNVLNIQVRAAAALSGEVTTTETATDVAAFKQLLLCDGDRTILAVSGQGTVDVFDSVTGKHRGRCLACHHDIVVAAASRRSDLYAVGGAEVTFASCTNRFRPRQMPALRSQVTGLQLITDRRHAPLPVVIMAACLDRSVRLFDAFSAITVFAYTHDSPMWTLSLGDKAVLGVSGVPSQRSLSLHLFRPLFYPATTTLAQTSQQLVQQLNLLPDIPVKFQRTFVLCAAARFRNVRADLLVSHVLPFARKTVLPNPVLETGPIKQVSRDGYVRSCLTSGDNVAVVSVDSAVHVWNLPNRQCLYVCNDRHTAPIVDVSAAVVAGAPAYLTTALDGTTVLGPVTSPTSWLVLRTGVPHFSGALDPPFMYLSLGGRQCRLERWSLVGTSCQVGHVHPVASQDVSATQKWLSQHGCAAAVRAFPNTLFSELLELEPSQIQSQAAALSERDVHRFQEVLDTVRRDKHKTVSAAALDDHTIVKDSFATFSPERVVDWVESQGLRCMALLLETSKTRGDQLLSMTEGELLSIGRLDYTQVVKVLWDEMAIVRRKVADSFGIRSFEDVVAWAKPKPRLLQFGIIALRMTGEELLQKTSFPLSNVMACPACGKTVSDPLSVCPEDQQPHTQLVPEWDAATTINVGNLAQRMKEHHVGYVQEFHGRLLELPDATFSEGMFWYPMVHEKNSLSCVTFSLPSLTNSKHLVVTSATLSVFPTSPAPCPMVAVPSTSPQLSCSLGGVQPEVIRFVSGAAEPALPKRWKKLSMRSYGVGSHQQPCHPTAPQATSLSAAGSCEAMSVNTKHCETFDELSPPKPEYFLVPAAEDPLGRRHSVHLAKHSTGSGTLIAQVADHVRASLKQQDRLINIMIVAEGTPESHVVLSAAHRPVLVVEYYYGDEQCECAGSSAAPAGHAAWCDRYCNVESPCRGHRCLVPTIECRRAPFLEWRWPPSRSSDGDSLSVRGVNPDGMSNLSRTNCRFIQERKMQHEPQHAVAPSNTKRPTTLSDVLSRPFSRSF